MLVTLHIPPGGTIKQLIGEVTELSGGVRPRTVSGRVGVLVDAEVAYRYLAVRHAPPAPEGVGVAGVPTESPIPDLVPAPRKAVPAKKATRPVTSKGE